MSIADKLRREIDSRVKEIARLQDQVKVLQAILAASEPKPRAGKLCTRCRKPPGFCICK